MTTAAAELKRSWRSLLLTDLFYQLAAFALLTPLVSLGIRFLVSLSGSAVLADQDILAFALSPIGIAALVAAAAGRIAVLALGQACLMGIALGASGNSSVRVMPALAWGAVRLGPILSTTVRLVVEVLLVCAPFLGLAALAYFLLLTDFDINYYLRERPPSFRTAAIVIGALLLAMAALLIRRSPAGSMLSRSCSSRTSSPPKL
jgi:hypothetical protein